LTQPDDLSQHKTICLKSVCFKSVFLMKKLLMTVLLAIAIVVSTVHTPALAATASPGAKVFSANCASCHMNGGNIVSPSKTLKQADLKKNGLDSVPAIVAQVTKGKAAMPSFKSRLKSAQIEAVANYVLDSSAKDWK
jgi:cytochrome c6